MYVAMHTCLYLNFYIFICLYMIVYIHSFSAAISALANSSFTGNVYSCSGSEVVLSSCPKSSSICNLEARVVCYISMASTCSAGRLRFVDMESDNSGRLELCYDGIWTPFCQDWLSSSEVNKACQQLGFTGGCASPKQSADLYLPFTGVSCSSSASCQVTVTDSTCLNSYTCNQAGLKCYGEVCFIGMHPRTRTHIRTHKHM